MGGSTVTQWPPSTAPPEVGAVIFDLDGVLVDTAKYHFRGWKRLADELGIPFTEEDNERLKGVSRMESLEIILEIGGKSFSDDEKQKLADRKNGYYQEYIQDMSEDEILPGARELLRALRERGTKLAVASASKNGATIVRRIRLDPYFDARVFGQDIEHSKPHPEIFLISAERLGESPGHCIVVEDAAAGIEAARRAGMRAVGVGSEEHLGEADLVVAGLDEVTAEQLLGL